MDNKGEQNMIFRRTKILPHEDTLSTNSSVLWVTTQCSCWFLFGLLFNPDDGENMFPRNVGLLSTDYTNFYPTIQLLITIAVRALQLRTMAIVHSRRRESS
jgi:hypothetical protein